MVDCSTPVDRRQRNFCHQRCYCVYTWDCRLLIGVGDGCCRRQGRCHQLYMPVPDDVRACDFVVAEQEANANCWRVMWSHRLVPVMRRSPAFCSDWGFRVWAVAYMVTMYRWTGLHQLRASSDNQKKKNAYACTVSSRHSAVTIQPTSSLNSLSRSCSHFKVGNSFSTWRLHVAWMYSECAHEQHVSRTLTLTLTHTITAYWVSGNVVRVRILICATRQKPCGKRVCVSK